jgi:hypothetical protein
MDKGDLIRIHVSTYSDEDLSDVMESGDIGEDAEASGHTLDPGITVSILLPRWVLQSVSPLILRFPMVSTRG